MRGLTVLVTAAGAPFMPGLAACLYGNGERTIRIVGVDKSGDNTISQIVDCYYRVPGAGDKAYMERILEICKMEKVDIILPFMSQELLQFQHEKERFKRAGTIVSVADNHFVEIANHKLRFYSFLKERGIPVPAFFPVRSLTDLERALAELDYPERPVCVKLAESSGSRGVRILDARKSRAELLLHEKPNSMYISLSEFADTLNEMNRIPEMMAMEYLPGAEWSVDILADHGKVLYMCGRESNVISASIPLEATLRENKAAYEICRQVSEAFAIDGNADFDFKCDADGAPVLMEVNPRIAATMGIFFAGGLNLPYLRIKQLLGESLPVVDVRYGVKMRRRYLEQFMAPDGAPIRLGEF